MSPYLPQIGEGIVAITNDVRGEIITITVINIGCCIVRITQCFRLIDGEVILPGALHLHHGILEDTRYIECDHRHNDAPNVEPCPVYGPNVLHSVGSAHGPESVGGNEDDEPYGAHVSCRGDYPHVADVRPGPPQVWTLLGVAARVRQGIRDEHCHQQNEIRTRQALDERRGWRASVFLESGERQCVSHHAEDAGNTADNSPENEVEQGTFPHGE